MSDAELRHRLAAILAADVAGYSRLMAADEQATLAALDAARAIFRSRIEASGGRVADMAGDSVLAVFETVLGAVDAALSVQQLLVPASRAVADHRRLLYRIGVNLGDVIEKPDGTVYGDGVNVAARLQALAEPGGIAVSDAVRNAVATRVAAVFVDQGERILKNIPIAIRWHHVVMAHADGSAMRPALRTADQLTNLPSIAILPFRTLGQGPEQASLADGLRIDIQGALVKIAGLALIGIGTTNTYRGKDVTPQQAAAEMGVRYLLEGVVQRAGDRARITASLIDGASGQTIWTEHYDRTLNESFDVQDEITEKVVTALDVKLLSGEQAKVWRKTIRNPKAREHFYRGIHEFMKGQKEANAAAREDFERVARLAAESSLGPTFLALTHWWDAFRGWSRDPAKSLEIAGKWASHAMTMDDADGQAHTVMAYVHLLRREHDRALEIATTAVALRPNCTNANAQLANVLHYCGRPADAADHIRQAIRLTPVHAAWFDDLLAASCKEVRQWAEAKAVATEVLRTKPDDIDARLVLIEVGLATGDVRSAREFAHEVLVLQPDFSVNKWAESQPYKDLAVLERIAAVLRSAGLTS